jgi:hypothetical protein
VDMSVVLFVCEDGEDIVDGGKCARTR